MNLGLVGARVAENGGGEGGVEEELADFFGDEAEVKALCNEGAEEAADEEEELPEGGFGVKECLFEGGKVAFAAPGKYAEGGDGNVDAGAYERAVGYFFPFKIVCGHTGVEDFAAAAPEDHAAAVDFSEHEEEYDGGKEEVEWFVCAGGNAEDDAEHEEHHLQVFEQSVFVGPGLGGTEAEGHTYYSHRKGEPCGGADAEVESFFYHSSLSYVYILACYQQKSRIINEKFASLLCRVPFAYASAS